MKRRTRDRDSWEARYNGPLKIVWEQGGASWYHLRVDGTQQSATWNSLMSMWFDRKEAIQIERKEQVWKKTLNWIIWRLIQTKYKFLNAAGGGEKISRKKTDYHFFISSFSLNSEKFFFVLFYMLNLSKWG